jgi:hypothetical protein
VSILVLFRSKSVEELPSVPPLDSKVYPAHQSSNGPVSECPPAKVRHFIIQTVHILQHYSAVTGSLPEGDIMHGNPNLLPNNLARQ